MVVAMKQKKENLNNMRNFPGQHRWKFTQHKKF